MDITKIKSAVPKVVYDALTQDFQSTYLIDSELRLAHFLAQCSYESATFTETEENLNYSAKRLREVWPTIFTSDEIANEYEKKPEKIANKVYANKNGNGDVASGDGYKFRGRGYIQLTFRNNYKDFDKYVTEDCLKSPDLVATKYQLASAGYFFKVNKIHLMADVGDTEEVVKTITKKVSNSTSSAADRYKLFTKLHNLLTSKEQSWDELRQELNDLKDMYADISLKLYRMNKK